MASVRSRGALELDAPDELNGAWSCNRVVPFTELIAGCGHIGYEGIPGAAIGVALGDEVVVVERVEEVRLESEVNFLRDPRVLRERDVQVAVARSVNGCYCFARAGITQSGKVMFEGIGVDQEAAVLDGVEAIPAMQQCRLAGEKPRNAILAELRY